MVESNDRRDTSQKNRFYRFLEDKLFRWIISYTTHPIHILALLALWIALLVIHSTIFELVGGNYTNGLSAMAASIVLLQQVRGQHELRKLHHEHGNAIQRLEAAIHASHSSPGRSANETG